MRLLGKSTSQKRSLLLSAGKSGNLAIAEIFKLHRLKGLIHYPTVLFTKPFPPSQGLIPSHFDHSAHRDREIPVDRRALRQIRYLRNGQVSTVTMKTHRSSFQRHKADQRFKKRSLACAVWSEQADTRTASQFKIHMMNSWNSLVRNC